MNDITEIIWESLKFIKTILFGVFGIMWEIAKIFWSFGVTLIFILFFVVERNRRRR